MDGRMDERTNERKISPFYRTSSPIRAAAQKPPFWAAAPVGADVLWYHTGQLWVSDLRSTFPRSPPRALHTPQMALKTPQITLDTPQMVLQTPQMGSRGGDGDRRSEIGDRRLTIALCGTIGHRPLPGPLPHHDNH